MSSGASNLAFTKSFCSLQILSFFSFTLLKALSLSALDLRNLAALRAYLHPSCTEVVIFARMVPFESTRHIYLPKP